MVALHANVAHAYDSEDLHAQSLQRRAGSRNRPAEARGGSVQLAAGALGSACGVKQSVELLDRLYARLCLTRNARQLIADSGALVRLAGRKSRWLVDESNAARRDPGRSIGVTGRVNIGKSR